MRPKVRPHGILYTYHVTILGESEVHPAPMSQQSVTDTRQSLVVSCHFFHMLARRGRSI